jgi:hypothetical protein
MVKFGIYKNVPFLFAASLYLTADLIENTQRYYKVYTLSLTILTVANDVQGLQKSFCMQGKPQSLSFKKWSFLKVLANTHYDTNDLWQRTGASPR